jgi:hypothetical protein
VAGVVQVQWDSGHENSYRWGAEGARDLEVYIVLKSTTSHTSCGVPSEQ